MSIEQKFKMVRNLSITDPFLEEIRNGVDEKSTPNVRWTLVRDRRLNPTDYGVGAIATDLTDDEAADATLSHLFTDYDSMSTDQVIELVKPMMLRDESILTDVRRGAISYFYALDQSPQERGDALVAYGNALSMATAGSVEGCLEALLLMIGTGDVPPGDTDFVNTIVGDLQEYLMKFPR